jgi:predicted dehydrogenase
MQKHVLVLTTSAFFLACGTIAASAQQGPMTQQQPQMLQQRREQERQVSHWHALNDAAYLRHLVAMPDVELMAIQDSDAGLVAKRAAEVGSPPTFTDYRNTDYRKMLAMTRPDFVLALGRHRQMAGIAHDLLDQGYPLLMEKPMGINAPEVEAVAAKAARLNAFVAVPLAQRYAPFATRARELRAAGRFGPLSHIYVRINRPGPARYAAWDCAWMLDPAEAGGGCLRNLGPHGLDMFLHLTGEEAQVTGAQLSWRAHERPVEDYASVMLRSASGILGTVEVGNGFPRDGTDGEWKIAGRDTILTMKDEVMKLATAEGDETLPGTNVTGPYFTAVRDALDHWRRGAAPPISVHDCARAVRLIDQAYQYAG